MRTFLCSYVETKDSANLETESPKESMIEETLIFLTKKRATRVLPFLTQRHARSPLPMMVHVDSQSFEVRANRIQG